MAATASQTPAKRNPLVWVGITAAVLGRDHRGLSCPEASPDGSESPKPVPTPISAESEGATQQGSETQASTSPLGAEPAHGPVDGHHGGIDAGCSVDANSPRSFPMERFWSRPQ